MNRKMEVKYYHRIQKILESEINKIASIVRTDGIQNAISVTGSLITSDIPVVVNELYNEVGLARARMQWRVFLQQTREAKGFGFNAEWVQFIHDYLYRFLIDKITFEVTKTTRDVLLALLNRAVADGWGIDKTVSAMKELPLSRTQAARIARTETTRASNTGAMAAGSTFEYEQTKEWIAAHDKRTRGQNPGDHASHIGLDGIIIDYEDYFTDPVNGDKLRYPGDPEGSAASVINCRCSIAILGKRDENNRLIPKKIKVTA